jgi:DNA polymerase III epsilon subunit-like protein
MRLVFDTETGGFNASTNALLSLGLVLWDKGQLVSELEVLVNDQGLVEPQALAVNRINLEEHLKVALLPVDGVAKIRRWLDENRVPPWDKVELVAHNIGFDVPFLEKFWNLGGGQFRTRFSHQRRCTMVLATMMKDAGILPVPDFRLEALMAYLNIPVEGRLHSALTDARGAARVYTKLLRLLHPEPSDAQGELNLGGVK